MLIFCLLVASALADVDSHEYRPPREQDSRSPCPGLNALANHGYLPRNGRGITPEMIQEAAWAVYGIKQSVLKIATDNAAKVGVFRDGVLTLGDLSATHNKIEHDVSLSRQDKGVGEFIKPVPALIEELLSANPGSPFITDEDIAAHRRRQYFRSKTLTPGFTWDLVRGGKQIPVAGAESTFISLIFGRDGRIDKAQVREFLTYERIPYNLGFRRVEQGTKFNFIRKTLWFTRSLYDVGLSQVRTAAEALRAVREYIGEFFERVF